MVRVGAADAIDLQLHTVYSDGAWRPTELLDYLTAHDFRVVAVTDHDTLDHVEDLVALGAARGVLVLRAVEVTTSWRELRADLLCYASHTGYPRQAADTARFTGEPLRTLVRATERMQHENTLAVQGELLRRGYTFPRQSEVLAAQGGQLRRPIDNAYLLLGHGYAATMSAAIEAIRAAGYRSIAAPLAEAVAAAHASGAVALIAHPGREGDEISRFDPPLLDEVLQGIPLDGLEMLYPTHTPEQVAAYAAFAEQRGLLRSAGSDSHGPATRLPIPYPAASCAQLLARCGVAVDSAPAPSS
jgi:predicted metal-dependent phosphoesterase TrpH